MYYPQVEENTNTRSMISTWYGYNHNYRINDGEFYDMENMSTDGYPVLIPRDVRKEVAEAENTYRGVLLTGGYLAYIDGNTFHYSDWSIDLTPLIKGWSINLPYEGEVSNETIIPGTTELTLLRFGAYVLVFQLTCNESIDEDDWKPIYVNVEDLFHSAGLISPTFISEEGITIKYSLSKKDGSDYENVTVSDTAPENPQAGDYWLSTAEYNKGLYCYIDSSWEAVATTYIRIEVPGAKLMDYFEEGDVVFLNNVDDAVKEYNDGIYIETINDEFIVTTGLLSEVITRVTDANWKFTAYRKMPTLDYICVDKNRVWGCRYGYTLEDGLINEIYCSKLGDFKNWNSYQGLSTDSYALTIGIPGPFTGCISFGGYPTFFKENAIIKIYGSYPAEYQMDQTDARGVQSGSYKSLAIVGETLYYKAPAGIMAYDGANPVSISAALGRTFYFDGVGAACGNKYYVEIYTNLFAKYFMVYDTEHGLWTRESAEGFIQLTGSIDGQLYGITKSYVKMLGRLGYIEPYTMPTAHTLEHVGEDIQTEEYVTWSATTGDFGYEYPDFKWVSRLTLRAYVPAASEIQVEISYDDKPFEQVGVIRGREETMTQTLAICPFRCDHYKLKFSGHGAVRIYSLAITLDTGGEEYGYKN